MIGFWLNLDAELELERPEAYRPSPQVEARMATLRPRLEGLLGDEGRVVGVASCPPGTPGLAWCPTPSALRALVDRGFDPAPHPPLDVLQRVNHRSFCASLGQTLEGAAQVSDMLTLRELIQETTPTGDWVIKRPFGFAGRERRRAIGGVLDESTEGFARTSFARGDVLQVEPWVVRELDVALHGYVFADGRIHVGTTVVQHCDAMGRFQRVGQSARDALGDHHDARAIDEGRRVAVALRDAGYFGPFGIDGYLYRDLAGSLRFNPRCEINARFTMGYRWPPGTDARVAAQAK